MHRAGEEAGGALVVVELAAKLLPAFSRPGISARADHVFFGPREGHYRIVLLVLERDDAALRDPAPGLRSCRRTEPLAEHRRRRAAGGDRRGEGDIRRIHELAQVHIRQIERLADLVVAVAALVLGKQLLDAQFREMQEISQGVFILLPGQASIERPAGPGDLPRIGLMEPVVQQREGGGRLLGRWPLVRLRRHLAGRDPVVHPFPEPEVLGIVHRHRKRVEVETALLCRRIMAFQTMVLEEAPEPRVRRRSRRGHDSEGE